MRNEAGRRWYHSIGLALICTRGNFKTKINIPNFQNSALHWYFYVPLRPEPIFVNVLGVPELIPDSQCGSPNATKESPGHVLLSNNCMYSIFLWSFLFLTVPHRLVSTSPLTFPLHFGSGPTIRLNDNMTSSAQCIIQCVNV